MDYIYVEVAIPIPHFSTFTYKIPQHLLEKIENKNLIGRRVLVPFRKSGITGIITDISQEIKDIKIREIFGIPDKEPVFDENYIKIIKNLSSYYVSPIGMFLYYSMPEGLRWQYNPKTGNWIKKVSEEKIYKPNVLTLNNLPKLSQQSKDLLEYILQQGEVTKEEIKEAGFSLNSLKTLLKKDLVLEESPVFFKEEKTLKQSPRIYKRLPLKKGFYIYDSDILKNRVKTYIKIINSNLEKQKSTLIILPNLQSIEKFFSFFKSLYGDKVFLYYDSLPEKEKVKNWFLLKKLKGTVTIGTFSSLFIPIKDLSTIILEEEYSESYKSKRTPKFDARRVAFQIYRERELSLVFSSSVLSLESFYSLKKKAAKRLFQKNIFQTTNNPKIEIKPFRSFNEIKKLVLQKTKKEKSVLITANKRGFYSFLYCDVCETEILCNRCDAPVRVYKEDSFFLKCDICGKKYRYIKECPECENPLKEIGFGIDRIMQLLKEENIPFSTIDQKNKTDIKLAVSLSGKEAIIDEFDTVINIYPDFYLNLPDFRSNEKFFRNIVLPSFKAKKEYILITNAKETTAVKSLLKKDLSIFLEEELNERKSLDLPPFSKYILLTFEKKDLSIKEVEKIFQKWLEENGINIEYEGIFYAPFSKIRDKKRIQILLKNFSKKELLINLEEKASKKGIKLNIDVDPREIK